MKKIKKIIALVIIVFVMAALLITVFFLTKNKIANNEFYEITDSYRNIYPDAASFMNAEYNNELLQRYLDSEGYTDDKVLVSSIVYAKDETGSVYGVLFTIESYKRNGGIVSLCVGINVDGSVQSIDVLEITDQKGLDVMIDKEKFKSQFYNKLVDEFVLITTTVTNDKEILEITGAHDACQAVVDAVNGSLKAFVFIDGSEGGFLNY